MGHCFSRSLTHPRRVSASAAATLDGAQAPPPLGLPDLLLLFPAPFQDIHA